MNEVEKMYENAGIRPNYIDACTVEDKYWQNEELANEYGTFDMYMNAKCGHQEDCTTLCSCAYTKEEYPPFTSEKQLELIKLLSYYYNITISKNFENDYTFQCEGDDVRRYVFTSGQDFAEQIASFVNMCYELLPEEERKQIKEILSE